MRPTAAASGFVMFLLSVKVIHGVDDWEVTCTPTQICAVKGSTVDLHCSYTNPERKYGRETTVKETFWDVSGRESEDVRTSSQYSAGVRHSCSQNNCTMTITDLRVRDSAAYKLRRGQRSSGSPGVTLTVTDLQVKVRPYGPLSSWYDLTCESSCQLGPVSYVWYRNGEEVHGQTSSSYSDYFTSKDSVSCAVKGQERFPSTSVCVFGGSCTKVTYAERNICAVKGSTVNISSSYYTYGSIRSLLWSSHEQQFPYYPQQSRDFWYKDGRVSVSDKYKERCTLRIRDLTESDSAVYKFSLESSDPNQRHSGHPGVTLTVSALQVQVIRTASQSQPYIELKCHISCRPAAHLSFVWFIGENPTLMKPSSTYRHYFKDEDIISCALEGHENYRSASVYAPRPPSVSLSPSAEVVEGSSVTLNCSTDANPAANYTWYKENQSVLTNKHVRVFSSIQSSDSGEYYCTAENDLGKKRSEILSIDVKYAPRPPSVSVSPSAEVVEGSSVTLNCSADANPAANYTWYKENQSVLTNKHVRVFSSIQSSDSGEYYCTAENDLGKKRSEIISIDVKYAPRPPSVSVSPSAEIMENSSVTLKCSADANPAAKYTWYKENQTLYHGPEGIYHFRSISCEDRGFYYCKAENQYGQISSSSQYIDVQSCRLQLINIIRLCLIIVAPIPLIVFHVWMRKKKTWSSSAEQNDGLETAEGQSDAEDAEA